MRENKKLIIVVPCYNEEQCIKTTAGILLRKLNSLIEKDLISVDSQICFVNDGSNDKTLELLYELAESNDKFGIVNLARNYGHQYAIYAGMKSVKADMVVTMDADLQDDVNAIDEMVKAFHEGNEIVYGCRERRDGDTFFKEITAILYYKIIRIFCPNIYYNHADFRLMSSKALNLLKEYPEKTIFLRGLIPSIGLKSTKVFYNRSARIAGEIKYTLSKMIDLAWRGIINSSVLPLRFVSVLGVFLTIVSFIVLIVGIAKHTDSQMFIILSSMGLFTGIIVLSLGIIAEYLAVIFKEVKNRPAYLIESMKNID